MGARLSKGMPSYAEVLEPEEIDKIHAYLIKRANDLLDEEYSDDQ
jgi:quinohemoprotein ethanol dehydrogenase